MPNLLNADQKQMRKRISHRCLDCFKKNPNDWWTKTTVEEWMKADGSATQKSKSIVSAGKIMTSVFSDAKRILLIDYLKKGKVKTDEY